MYQFEFKPEIIQFFLFYILKENNLFNILICYCAEVTNFKIHLQRYLSYFHLSVQEATFCHVLSNRGKTHFALNKEQHLCF